MLKDFEEFLEEPLILPIGGKKYTVPPVDAVSGVRLSETLFAAQTDTSNPDVEDDTELDIYKQTLGAAYDEMIADNVPFPALMRAGKTAMYDFIAGREVAERYWNTGSIKAGEPAGKVPQDRKPKKTSTSTGAAKKTPSRASTTGTKSPTKPSSKPKAAT